VPNVDLFATAAPGTEGALRDELRELRFRGVKADRGGVHFHGTLSEAGRACLESRIAIRILVKLAEFDAPDEQTLYDGVHAVDWTPWISPKHTLAVSAVARASKLFHTKYLAQKTKDAIVDQLRDKLGSRPNVDVEDADVRVFLHLVKDHASIFLDAAGESLHRRGWRYHIGEAPLKETMAAACLRLAEWDRVRPLLDPMCGAGTIAIEAEQWSRAIAPGLMRAKFGVERWASADAVLAASMKDMRDRAKARAMVNKATIIGADKDAKVLDFARKNAKAAHAHVRFEQRDLADVASLAPSGCMVLTNPPYDLRLEAGAEFYSSMARAFRALRGCTVAIIAGNSDIERAMGRPRKWQSIANGPIEVRLLIYDI
jgi:putative N6-adenine-specific DNA methylase